MILWLCLNCDLPLSFATCIVNQHFGERGEERGHSHAYGASWAIFIGESSIAPNAGLNASNLLSLVYIAAYAPKEGESVLSINALFPAPSVGKDLTLSYRSGFIWINPPAFPQDFMQDVEESEALAIAATEKPLAPECFGAPSGSPTWKTVPSWYLVSKNDRVINPDAERFMAKRMGATTREIASSHASPVSHPKAVFDLIVAASR